MGSRGQRESGIGKKGESQQAMMTNYEGTRSQESVGRGPFLERRKEGRREEGTFKRPPKKQTMGGD